jgi:hypothetical protein
MQLEGMVLYLLYFEIIVLLHKFLLKIWPLVMSPILMPLSVKKLLSLLILYFSFDVIVKFIFLTFDKGLVSPILRV